MNGIGMRYITLQDGTGMGDELIIFRTNAPLKELKALEKQSCEVYASGKDAEDVPIWRDVLTAKGYAFIPVDVCTNITPHTCSGEWLKGHEIGKTITEQYVIENQPRKECVKKYVTAHCECINLCSQEPWYDGYFIDTYVIFMEYCSPVSREMKQGVEVILKKLLFEQEFFEQGEHTRSHVASELEVVISDFLREYINSNTGYDVGVICKLRK